MPDSNQGTRSLRRRDIDPDAIKVVKKLLANGHEAYLVGGCVRDLYLNRRPKDFDVATSATPEAIRKTFRNSRIIGRRFKLAHVFFGPKIIETSTFRSAPKSNDRDPLITHDNEWGSIEDDARRRDFTINGLFYDLPSDDIVDFVDGLHDLERGVIRTIGEPVVRFQEDPVRMIRAIKFAARLNFAIEDQTWRALLDTASDITKCSRARVLEELYKLMRGGASHRSFELMLETGLLQHITPTYATYLEADDVRRVLFGYLEALDAYTSGTRQKVSNGVLLAVLFAPLLNDLWPVASRQQLDGRIEELTGEICVPLGMARRDRELARQILMAHRRMIDIRRPRRRRSTLVQRQYFHDALVFLGLSVRARGTDGGELRAWQHLAALHTAAASQPAPARRRKRKRRKKSGKNGEAKTHRTPDAAERSGSRRGQNSDSRRRDRQRTRKRNESTLHRDGQRSQPAAETGEQPTAHQKPTAQAPKSVQLQAKATDKPAKAPPTPRPQSEAKQPKADAPKPRQTPPASIQAPSKSQKPEAPVAATKQATPAPASDTKQAPKEQPKKAVKQPTTKATEPQTKKVTKQTTQEQTKKVAKKQTKKAAKKQTKKVAKKQTKKAAKKQTKKVAKKQTKKVAKKVAKKQTKKVPKKVAKKQTKKVAKKQTKKVAKKQTKKAAKKQTKKSAKQTKKAAKKQTKKAAKKQTKKSAKKQTKKVSKKAAKKQTKKVAKKQTKKAAKKQTKKAAKKQTKKVAKKQTKKAAKKQTKKVAKKQTKKVAKKQTKKVAKKQTKKAAKKTSKKQTKKSAKKSAKKQTKKVAKKTSKKQTKKVAKKTSKKQTKKKTKKVAKKKASKRR